MSMRVPILYVTKGEPIVFERFNVVGRKCYENGSVDAERFLKYGMKQQLEDDKFNTVCWILRTQVKLIN